MNYIVTGVLLVVIFIVILFVNIALIQRIGFGTGVKPHAVEEAFWNNPNKNFDTIFKNHVEFVKTNKTDKLQFNTNNDSVVNFNYPVIFRGESTNKNGTILLKDGAKIITAEGATLDKNDVSIIKETVKKIKYTNDHARTVTPLPTSDEPNPKAFPLKTLGNNQCTKTLGRIIKGTCTTQTAKDICESCACNPIEDDFSLSIHMKYKKQENQYENLSLYVTNNTTRYIMQSIHTKDSFDATFYIKSSNPNLKWVLLFLNDTKYDFLDIDTRNKNYVYDFLVNICQSKKEHYMITSNDITNKIRNERVNLATSYHKTGIPKSDMVILLVAY